LGEKFPQQAGGGNFGFAENARTAPCLPKMKSAFSRVTKKRGRRIFSLTFSGKPGIMKE